MLTMSGTGTLYLTKGGSDSYANLNILSGTVETGNGSGTETDLGNGTITLGSGSNKRHPGAERKRRHYLQQCDLRQRNRCEYHLCAWLDLRF